MQKFVKIFELAKKQRKSISFTAVVFSEARNEFAYPSVGVMKQIWASTSAEALIAVKGL